MPQSTPTIVALIVANPLPVVMHSAYLTVAMIDDECLDPLSEMSQVCEQRLTSLQVLEPVPEVIEVVDTVEQFEGPYEDSDINGSFRKICDARIGNAEPGVCNNPNISAVKTSMPRNLRSYRS
jgi:hypothetical protein